MTSNKRINWRVFFHYLFVENKMFYLFKVFDNINTQKENAKKRILFKKHLHFLEKIYSIIFTITLLLQHILLIIYALK